MAENVVISVRLDIEEKNALAEYAKEHDLSMSQVIRRAIKDYINKQETNS